MTVLVLDDLTAGEQDRTVHSIAHGVLRLEQLTPEYGAERRRLRVISIAASGFAAAITIFTIKTGGVEVFPALVAAESRSGIRSSVLSSGIAELDKLLGGGIESGSSTLVLGPAGTGKSLLVLQFAAAAVKSGKHVALFIFDEELGLLFLAPRR